MTLSTVTLARCRCRINAPLARRLGLACPADLEPIVRRAVDAPQPFDTILKSDSRSVVRRFDVADRSWVVKRYAMADWIARWYRRWQVSPEWREWKASQRLVSLGIRVNEPLAILHDPSHPGAGGLIVLPYVAGPTLHELIEQTSAGPLTAEQRRQRLRIARALGAQMGRLTAAGLVNRDHKPGNLIVDDSCLAGAEPVVIDLCGLRRRNGRNVERMLATLVATIIRIGRLDGREGPACLKAMVAADPTIGADRRTLARRVRRRAERLRDEALAREQRLARRHGA